MNFFFLFCWSRARPFCEVDGGLAGGEVGGLGLAGGVAGRLGLADEVGGGGGLCDEKKRGV